MEKKLSIIKTKKQRQISIFNGAYDCFECHLCSTVSDNPYRTLCPGVGTIQRVPDVPARKEANHSGYSDGVFQPKISQVQ